MIFTLSFSERISDKNLAAVTSEAMGETPTWSVRRPGNNRVFVGE
jgi:hypothetical protein